jgi:hypothetical protein
VILLVIQPFIVAPLALSNISLLLPDLVFVVSKVCQFMQCLMTDHWTAIKRILCYLQQIIHYNILIRRTLSTDIHAFSDVDWAGCPNDK